MLLPFWCEMFLYGLIFQFPEALELTCRIKSAPATFEDKKDPFPVHQNYTSTVKKHDDAWKGSYDDDRGRDRGNCITQKPLLESKLLPMKGLSLSQILSASSPRKEGISNSVSFN